VASNVIIRDARIADSFIELDCSIPNDVSLNDLLLSLGRVLPIVEFEHILELHLENADAIKRAVQRFNAQKYWSAHEALEQVWKRSSGDEKEVINGIILVAAALVHYQKDETEICLSILSRAIKKLQVFQERYYDGIDVDNLKSVVARILASGSVEQFSI
jgi:predicted metal-dependent hydrolase